MSKAKPSDDVPYRTTRSPRTMPAWRDFWMPARKRSHRKLLRTMRYFARNGSCMMPISRSNIAQLNPHPAHGANRLCANGELTGMPDRASIARRVILYVRDVRRILASIKIVFGIADVSAFAAAKLRRGLKFSAVHEADGLRIRRRQGSCWQLHPNFQWRHCARTLTRRCFYFVAGGGAESPAGMSLTAMRLLNFQ